MSEQLHQAKVDLIESILDAIQDHDHISANTLFESIDNYIEVKLSDRLPVYTVEEREDYTQFWKDWHDSRRQGY